MRTIKALVLAAALAAPLAGCGINTIPTREEVAKEKWAQVQNQYQRRADLIPNLVATVKGYAAQERAVLVEVTEARARATSVQVTPEQLADQGQVERYAAAQNQLGGALGRLLVTMERYPDLKSNQNFLALQDQLEGTENRITVARGDYNEAVRDYNLSLRTLPTSLWAGTLYRSARPLTPFTATAQAQTAPTVSFEPTAPAPAAGQPGAMPGAAPAP